MANQMTARITSAGLGLVLLAFIAMGLHGLLQGEAIVYGDNNLVDQIAFSAIGVVVGAGFILAGQRAARSQATEQKPPTHDLMMLCYGMGLIAMALLLWFKIPEWLFIVSTLAIASGGLVVGSTVSQRAIREEQDDEDFVELDEQVLTHSTAPKVKAPASVEAVDVTDLTFDGVVGMADAKQDLTESIHLIEHPEIQAQHGLPPVRGILLHGPPGTGKTFFARAAAGTFGKKFLRVKSNELVSKFVGETEKNIAEVFAYARSQSPCILFFDEFDAIAVNRKQMSSNTEHLNGAVNQLLQEMDGIQKSNEAPIVLAATNYAERLDDAILRPGRFDRKVLVDLPDQDTREALLEMYLRPFREQGRVDSKLNTVALAKISEGQSPAQLKGWVQDVSRLIYREDPSAQRPRALTMLDFRAVWEQQHGTARLG